MPRSSRPVAKDMYWFAQGGPESSQSQRTTEDDPSTDSYSPTFRVMTECRNILEEQRCSQTDGSNSSGPSSLEPSDRLHPVERRTNFEERRRLLHEAEQEKNDAVLRKHMERDAALEAKRNAQRSTIAFAFGSSVPRNVDALSSPPGGGESDVMTRSFHAGFTTREENHGTFRDMHSVSPLTVGQSPLSVDCLDNRPGSSQSLSSHSDRRAIAPPCWLVGSGAVIGGEDMMSKSMYASMPAPCGRRKNDLMPTVPYNRLEPAPRTSASATRKRSVSMTRLDQLAMPRRHYVEATKAGKQKDSKSPSRPLSSASENSGGSNKVASSVTRRVRTSPRKPRPVSIAGTMPDSHATKANTVFKASPLKRSNTPSKKTGDSSGEVKKTPVSTVRASTPRLQEKSKPSPRPTTASKPKPATHKPATPRQATPKTTPKPESKLASKAPAPSKGSSSTPKTPAVKKTPMPKAKPEVPALEPLVVEEKDQVEQKMDNLLQSPDTDPDSEKTNGKRIISEEEARAALAEKRRLAREQAEKEAELEKQRLEALQHEEEERVRQEEEDQRRLEEEHLHLMEEHKKSEEEKLRRAIEEQEQKEEQERRQREEEQRVKAEQERKAKEEAEKQRLEFEENLRKEEEERAERKKRLDKIMSRTRSGKSNGASPSGSISGGEVFGIGENADERLSSGTNSLDSNEGEVQHSEVHSGDEEKVETHRVDTAEIAEIHAGYEMSSEGESLNSNDLMLPSMEEPTKDASPVIAKEVAQSEVVESTKDTSPVIAKEVAQSEVVESQGSLLLAAAKTEESVQLENQIPQEEIKSEEVTNHEENVQLLESEVKKMSFNVNAPEFTPSGFGDYGQQQVNMEADAQFEDSMVKSTFSADTFSTSFPVTEHKGEELDQVEFPNAANPQDVDLQFGGFEGVQPSFEDVIASSAEDSFGGNQLFLSNQAAIPFKLPDPEADSEPRTSISSDIKLPDPIYDTSEDGSVSSEKRIQEDFREEPSGFGRAVDDVFSSENVQSQNPFGVESSVTAGNISNENPFGQNAIGVESSVAAGDISNENQFGQNVFGVQSSVAAGNISNENQFGQNVFGVESSVAAGNMSNENPFGQNASGVESSVAAGDISNENPFGQNAFGVESSVAAGNISNENPFGQNAFGMESSLTANASVQESAVDSEDEVVVSPRKEVQFDMSAGFYDMHTSSLQEERVSSPSSIAEQKDANFEFGDDRFQNTPFQPNELDFGPMGDVPVGSNETQKTEQFNPFENTEFGDVTVIKSEDTDDCIGIISSVDLDRTLNDFPKPNLNGDRLKSSFDYAADNITESEDSSLDSNLSQIETTNDAIKGLNDVVESSTNGVSLGGDGDHGDNLFNNELIIHNSSSKTNGGDLKDSQLFSNGHSHESSNQVDDLFGYGQIKDGINLTDSEFKDGDFNQGSDDPFLVKGSPKQLSGNPFAL